jgi:hypothetical protein
MKSGSPVDFDCMVEVAFADEDAFLAYMGKLFGPEAVDDAVAMKPGSSTVLGRAHTSSTSM